MIKQWILLKSVKMSTITLTVTEAMIKFMMLIKEDDTFL